MTRTAPVLLDLYSIQLQRGFESLRGTVSALLKKNTRYSTRGRTVRRKGLRKREYLKESSTGRMSGHDYNTREG